MKARVLGLIGVAMLGAALGAAATKPIEFSRVPVTLTPLAAPLVHESGGNLEVTFVEDLNGPKLHLGAVAYDLDGKAHNNDQVVLTPAARQSRVFLHEETKPGPHMVARITFQKLPLNRVKTIQIVVIGAGVDDPIAVELPASFGDPPAPPAPVSLAFANDNGRTTVTLSTGLRAVAKSSFSGTFTPNQVLIDAHLTSVQVIDPAGGVILDADIVDAKTDSPPATLPATQPAAPASP